MPQSYHALRVHIVFATHARKPDLDPAIAPRLYSFIGGICRQRDCVLLRAGGMPDHVHLLVSISREICAAELLRDIKAASSKWLHTEFPAMKAFSWQDGYGIFSVSVSASERVAAYIDGQAEHHKEMSFEEEFEKLLKLHEVEFDRKYLWKS